MIFLMFVVLHLNRPVQVTQPMKMLQPTQNVQQFSVRLQAGVPDDGSPELQPALGYGAL